jgi:hypothetical protein
VLIIVPCLTTTQVPTRIRTENHQAPKEQTKHCMRTRFLLAYISILVMTGSYGVLAAPVAWHDVLAVADCTDINKSGASVLATYYSGVSGNMTINGVTFTDSGTKTASQNGVKAALGEDVWGFSKGAFFSDNCVGSAAITGADAFNYTTLLASGCKGNTITLTISGLTIGKQYLVQFWAFDDWGKDSQAETITGSEEDTHVPTLVRKNNLTGSYTNVGGTHVVGTFTADSPNQTFRVTSRTAGVPAQLNGMQLRAVTGVTVLSAVPPTPLSALGVSAIVGSPFTYQVACFQDGSDYTSTMLPSGLSLNPATGLISGTPTDAGTYSTLLRAKCGGVPYTAQLILVVTPVPGTSPLSTQVPRGCMNNVPESIHYSLVYSLNIPSIGNFSTWPPPYSVDLSGRVDSFTRVAYYLELQSPGGTLQYVWVSMDAFTSKAGQLGVPTEHSGGSFQRRLNHVNVVSNVPGVAAGSGFSGTADFSSAKSGSMLVQVGGQTVFGFTNWTGAAGAQLGIGTDNLAPATGYSVKSLQVMVLNSAATVVVQPVPDPSLILNPGKGWVQYGYPDQLTQQYVSVLYGRTDWSRLEPKDGVYDWSSIDEMVTHCAKTGRKFGFRVMNQDGGVGVQYATPKWVFDAGAVSFSVPDDTVKPEGIHVNTKDWEDPVFLAKMKRFIAAFGARYNGNPNIAFIDIGNYGNWGEGNGGYAFPGASFVQKPVSPASYRTNFVEPYLKAFPNTRLMVLGTQGDYESVYDWAISQGAGRRNDSGFDSRWYYFGRQMVAYPRQPSFEENMDPILKESLKVQSDAIIYNIVGTRSTMTQLFWGFCDKLPDLTRMAGNLLGYHYILQQATIPKSIKARQPFPLSLTWFNDGVAPLFDPCQVAVALLDAQDNVIEKQWLKTSQPRRWMSWLNTTENFQVTFGSVPSGCKLAVGLFVNSTDAGPTYKLGIQGRTANGWYVISGPGWGDPTPLKKSR